jgi:hypothetical protein
MQVRPYKNISHFSERNLVLCLKTGPLMRWSWEGAPGSVRGGQG